MHDNHKPNFIGRVEQSYGESEALISCASRAKHVYVIGKSGFGKSTLLHNLAVQDIVMGRGVCLIDPHGDLVDELLNHIPRGRSRDVVYLNLADESHPVSWNPLEKKGGLSTATIAYGVMSACKHIWRESWGPRMEYVLTNALHALSETGESLLSLPRLLSDASYIESLGARVRDPKVKHFFAKEFGELTERDRREIVSPIQNKIGQLLTHPQVRGILASRKSTIDLRFMMDERRILLINLAKGHIGEEPANLLGSLIVSALITTALGRAHLPPSERRPFFLLVDEFQNFSTESFAGALSEVRKYGLSLVLAHQFMGQLSEKIRKAVFGNVSTKVLLGVGAEDAEALALEVAPYPAKFILEQGPYRALVCDGVREPYPVSLTPFIDAREHKLRTGRRELIVRESKRRFGRPSAEIERVVQAGLFPKEKRRTRSGGRRW